MEQRQSLRSARHWSEACYSLGDFEGKALGTEMQRAAISVLHKSANFYLGTETWSKGSGRGNERRLSSTHLWTGQDNPRPRPLVLPTSSPGGFPHSPTAHVLSLCCLLESRVCALHRQAHLPGEKQGSNLTLPLMPVSRGGLLVNCLPSAPRTGA